MSVFFLLLSVILVSHIQEIIAKSIGMKLCSVICSKSFIVSALRFRFLIPSELIYLYAYQVSIPLHSFACGIPAHQHHLLNRLFAIEWSYNFHLYYFICLLEFVSGLRISLFCLSLCQCHLILITVSLQEVLKGETVSPLTFFFFLMIVMAVVHIHTHRGKRREREKRLF